MQQHILKTLLFLSGLFGGLYVFNAWISAKAASIKPDNQKIGKVNRIMAQEIDVALSFWGPSTAWVHFNAALIEKQTGLSCHNMGIDGTFFQQYRGLFRYYLDYTKQSKFIAFAIYPYEFEPRTAFRDLHKFKHHYHNQALYEAFYPTLPYYSWKMHHVPFYRITNYDAHFYATVFCPEHQKNDDQQGFHPMYEGFHEGEATPPIVIDSLLFSDFRKALQQIKDKQIQPIVILIPFYIDGQRGINNFEMFHQKIKSLEQEGVKVLDYMRHDISAQKELFYSFGHLNHRGADSLSLMVSDEIKKMMRE